MEILANDDGSRQLNFRFRLFIRRSRSIDRVVIISFEKNPYSCVFFPSSYIMVSFSDVFFLRVFNVGRAVRKSFN